METLQTAQDALRHSQAVLDKVKADKLREVTDGHDGTWIAHPALLAVAKKARVHSFGWQVWPMLAFRYVEAGKK